MRSQLKRFLAWLDEQVLETAGQVAADDEVVLEGAFKRIARSMPVTPAQRIK
jgi:hypothetical protein